MPDSSLSPESSDSLSFDVPPSRAPFQDCSHQSRSPRCRTPRSPRSPPTRSPSTSCCSTSSPPSPPPPPPPPSSPPSPPQATGTAAPPCRVVFLFDLDRQCQGSPAQD